MDRLLLTLPPEALRRFTESWGREEAIPYCPHVPHPAQARFLAYEGREALYGGAAGGGKSDALLMAALQYAHLPGYRALLLRRTFADLALPGALMDRAREWFQPRGARWMDREKTWHLPSGASITFGYLATERHKYRYQSSEFHFVGFDELTQFTESQYTYLFSRQRRVAGLEIPIRMRAGTNPGGVGHEWVMGRFLPHLEPAEREEKLSNVDRSDRREPSVKPPVDGRPRRGSRGREAGSDSAS
jgi:hypothetical protein